jgi:undecaprenyl-diphosphatase
MVQRPYLAAAWLWIIGFSLFRWIYSGQFLLVPDETNYWQWSRHLALGYHDQAPLIAWAIHLGTLIFGHTETGVRFPSVLSVGVASAYLLLLANRYFGAKTAWYTAVISQAVLVFNVGGLLATPDGLQAAAWAGAAYHTAVAYEENRLHQWMLGGFWFGLGLLSKYTMVLFLPGAFLYGLFSPTHRNRLLGLRPYAGVAFGLLMFLPVIVWNARNHWNSVRHVAYLGGANETMSLHLKYFAELIASQAGLISPLILVLGLSAWYLAIRRPFRTDHWIYGYLFFTSFPMFAFFVLLSLHARVYGNWPAAGYLGVSVLAAAFFGDRSKPNPDIRLLLWGRKLWPWGIGTAYLFTFLLLTQVVWPILPVPPELNRPAKEILGWKKLGMKAEAMRKGMPSPDKTFLFGLRYQIASELAFYTPGQPQTVSINRWNRPNVYDYWWRDQDLTGWDAVGVTYRPDSHLNQLNQVFEQVEPPVRLDIYPEEPFSNPPAGGKPIKSLWLYRARGFKGGLRWQPPNQKDIRAY